MCGKCAVAYCATASDCPADRVCTFSGHRCDVACADATDCAPGEECSNGACRGRCVTDDECQTGEVCSSRNFCVTDDCAADGDRLLLAAGAGFHLADAQPILTKPIDLDLGVQWQHVASRLTRKHLDRFPGQAFSSGGDLLHVTLTSTVRF